MVKTVRQTRAARAREVVLRGLETANVSLARAVTAKEIAQAIPRRERDALAHYYHKDLPSRVSAFLSDLMRQKLVTSVGKKSARNFYVSARLPDAAVLNVP